MIPIQTPALPFDHIRRKFQAQQRDFVTMRKQTGYNKVCAEIEALIKDGKTLPLFALRGETFYFATHEDSGRQEGIAWLLDGEGLQMVSYNIERQSDIAPLYSLCEVHNVVFAALKHGGFDLYAIVPAIIRKLQLIA